MKNAVQRGEPYPLGANVRKDGVNFCLFSRHALGVDLLFFQHEDDVEPERVIPFEPVLEGTYHYWHAFLPGILTLELTGLDKPASEFLDSNGQLVAIDRVALRMEVWLTAQDSKNDLQANPK